MGKDTLKSSKKKSDQDDISILNIYVQTLCLGSYFCRKKQCYILNHILIIHTCSGRFHYPTLNKELVIQTKMTQKNPRANIFYKRYYPNTKEYAYLSAPHEINILKNKASLNRYKKIEISPCILHRPPQITSSRPP